jgi:hypothetical protein
MRVKSLLFLSPLNTFLSNSETTIFNINKTTAIPASWCSKIKFILNRFQDPISALTKRSGQRFKFGVLASLEESELIQKDSQNLSVNMEIKIVRKWTKTIWKTTYLFKAKRPNTNRKKYFCETIVIFVCNKTQIRC